MSKKKKVIPKETKEEKKIFVIMPFTQTPKRDKNQLTAFFIDQIKNPIEKSRFKYKFFVKRSDDTFNITENIIKDVYDADILICDLSGKYSNPNVMYELGMRLALTNKPVILIRESNPENKNIFDISGFYAFQYDPLNYNLLINYINEKLKKFEEKKEEYKSPVLTLLSQNEPLLMQMSHQRAREKLLFMGISIRALRNLFIRQLDRFIVNKKIKFNTGKTFDEAIESINKNHKLFNNIIFKDFRFSFSPQPIIDSYLSEQYLNNILDSEIVAAFTFYVIDFHVHYLGSSFFFNEWTPNGIYTFLGETALFRVMIDKVVESLKVDNENELKIIEKELKEIIDQSHIASVQYNQRLNPTAK